MALSQHQCPLFKLPRELRDEIYAYYTYEKDGYRYDRAIGRLRPASNRELHLVYSCKAIADEMQGIWLRTNTVTIVPSSVEVCEESVRGLRSRAARFECLLQDVRWTRIIMLHYAAECVTDGILDHVMSMYPSVHPIFRIAFRAIRNGFDLRHISVRTHRYRDIFSASFHDAVQFTLELISAHPNFESLISKACDSAQEHPVDLPVFAEDSHRKILDWKPCLWSIPSDEELSSMEGLLTQAPVSNATERAQGYHGIRWYFSATAVFIHVIHRLESRTRKQLRTVVLKEDCKSVGEPAVHPEGLIPFCIENPKLRIVMRAGFSNNLVPSLWDLLFIGENGLRGTNREPDPVTNYFNVLIDWIVRIAMLPDRGMPQNSFKVVLHAQSDEAIRLWSVTEQVAAARDVLDQEFLDREAEASPNRFLLMYMLQYVWRIPKAFSSAVKDIMAGTSIIVIDGPCSEPWTKGDAVSKYQDQSIAHWGDAYHRIDTTIGVPGGNLAYREKYVLET